MSTQNPSKGDDIRAAFADLMRRARQSERPNIGPDQALTQRESPIVSQDRRTRGPQIAPTKVQVSIRFDADLLDALRGSGRGWQGRANDILRSALALDQDIRKT